MRTILIAFLLAVPLFASDLHEQSVHDAAHFGLGFAIQTAVYGFSTRGLRMRGWDAVVFSTVVTALGTTMYEVADTAPGMAVNTRGIAFNLLGAATSSLTTWTFRFNWEGDGN